jgi:hypothetical protein
MGNPRVIVVTSRPIFKATALLLTGQHGRNPVTTKHEKRSHANHLFAISYGSFLGRQFFPNMLTSGAKSRSVEHIGGATLGQACHSQELGQDLNS